MDAGLLGAVFCGKSTLNERIEFFDGYESTCADFDAAEVSARHELIRQASADCEFCCCYFYGDQALCQH